jgi:ribonucleoside-diphosphate reductase alpha chain
MKAKSSKLRRIGLGTTGLADMLALLGHRYGSVEGNKFVDKLFRFISKQAYEASIILAVEKGSFESFDAKKHLETGFMKRMPNKIRTLIAEHGLRNCAILTQAPTGTVSLLSGNCSSGIEPMFAPAYERRFFKNELRQTELCFHPLLDQFLKEGKDVSHFVGSGELNIREHMEVQKIVQKHLDNAVSKTINMPEHYPIEEMSEAWLEYLPDLKGTTFYRENSRKYIDANGKEHEPPLVAIPLEQAIERRKKESVELEVAIVDDCISGVCEIPEKKN